MLLVGRAQAPPGSQFERTRGITKFSMAQAVFKGITPIQQRDPLVSGTLLAFIIMKRVKNVNWTEDCQGSWSFCQKGCFPRYATA